MTPYVRFAAKLAFVLQIPLALACSDAGGPAAPAADPGARLAGLLTTSDAAHAGAGDAFRGATALNDVRVDLVGPGGETVATVTTGPTGRFSTAVAAGTYTVRIALAAGPPLEFEVELPPGLARFAAGRVDPLPTGGFLFNVQVFNDGDGDAEPDDPFRVQILDLEAGDPDSGVLDVVETAEQAASVVTLCHVPPGNPDAAHTIEVGEPAVPVHVGHGDTEGPCPEEPQEDPEEEADPEEGEGEEEEESEEEETTVLVCHVPPGNPDAAHTIEVGESALPAHLAHGDTEGPCPDDPEPGDPEDEEEGEGEEEEVTVLVCHVPPGNPDAAHTIEIGESALPAHLAHGDTEGPCPGDAGPGGALEEEEPEED